LKKLLQHISLALILLFTSGIAQAQTPTETETETPIDSLRYRFNYNQSGSLYLSNFEDFNIVYNALDKTYSVVSTVFGHETSFPITMTAEQYKQYKLKRDMHDYYKTKIGATSKKKGSANDQKDLLPKYYVNSNFFETIFGGNEIEVNMQGNIEIKMGILHQVVDNPQLNESNRSTTIFDFKQDIGASIMANVGKRLKISANYDTQSTFDFQNLVKIEFDPSLGYDDDGIVRKIEVGNVSMPIRNTLMHGAQNLFGAKTELQFGKTTISAVVAKQQSQSKTVRAEGGAIIEEFEIKASDYDADRHFFLAQYFRKQFDEALLNYPLISSSVQITNIEVWVTNTNTTTENLRSIVALADLGEYNERQHVDIDLSVPYPAGLVLGLPDNRINELQTVIEGTDIRSIPTVSTAFNAIVPLTNPLVQGNDYSVLQNARRLVEGTDFILDRQLGFISLNRRLADSDVLAVAFEYTINGSETVYKVGELSSDGIIAPDNLVVKLLRPELVHTDSKVWDLMMKNIYNLQAYQLSEDGFRLELLYENDATGVPLNTLQTAVTDGISTRPLLNLFHIDRLDQNDISLPDGDGYFDFVEGITVFAQKGYIMFPKTEPFGSYIDNVLEASDDVFVFNELYEYTQQEVKNTYQSKDKYQIKGYFKSDSANGIALGAFNVPQGSVHVTSGGRELVEGVDYVVDYQIGRVKIINPSIEASNAPISVSVEQNAIFSQQRKIFIGLDVAHKFTDNFVVGASYLRLSEQPFTNKVSFGQEPLQNQIFGLNTSFSTESEFLSKITNRLPFHKSDAPSNFSIRGDVAYIIPGTPSSIDINGQAASYIDDFEGSQIPLNIRSQQQWFLASTPQTEAGSELESLGGNLIGLDYGKQRANLAWYNIDNDLHGGSQQPDNIDNAELSRAEVRRVNHSELFPEDELDLTESSILRTLDLAYFPNERGSYNFDTEHVLADGTFDNPEDRWGGITRPMTITDFENSNIEYIQFWMMNPYENYSITNAEGLPAGVDPFNPANQVGEFYINLGNISEDILKDGSKAFENGLPEDGGTDSTTPTVWGKVPNNPALLYAFDDDNTHRANQDIGLDGLTDEEEAALFGGIASEDPANDNFHFYKGTDLDDADASILQRYKRYNRSQGNSPTATMSTESYPTAGTQYPDTEDINKDQTMSTVESYWQYKISLNTEDLHAGSGYIVDERVTTNTLPDGTSQNTTWYQFRIPIASGTPINGISGFHSIRFMRMFLTKFKMPVVLRFGQMEMVRGEWRRYKFTMDDGNVPIPTTEIDNFESGVVNIEENDARNPIPYVLPPGIVRERLQGTTIVQEQNEQSLSLKIRDLENEDARALFKNVNFDLRMFKRLQLFIHAESMVGETPVEDNDLVAIVRLGSDLGDNFYQIEQPLKITEHFTTTDVAIWPAENELNVDLEALKKLKLERYDLGLPPNQLFPLPEVGETAGYRLRVKGHPNLGNIKTIMLGVRNKSADGKYAEIWFNELRASDFDNEGGWAAVLSADANFTDVLDLSVTGRMSTKGYGDVDQSVNERSQEDVMQYDAVSNLNVGKLLPDSWGLEIPLSTSLGEEVKQSKYDAQYQDILLEDTTLDNSPNRNDAQDYTKRSSISLINVRKNRNPKSDKKIRFYDIENLSVSYAYNKIFHKDYNVKRFLDENVRASAGYAYSFKPLTLSPFKKSKGLNGKYLKGLKSFSINLLPDNIAVNSNIMRTYNEQLSRSLIEGLPSLPTLTQRNFLFDWDYSVGYKPTKALRLNFRALNNHIYDDYRENNKDITLYQNFFNVGRPSHYHQNLDATYALPLDKLPLLNFIKSNYSYTADFDWQGASHSEILFADHTATIADLTGNIVQNANTHNLTVDLNMKKFYKEIGLPKLLRTKKQRKQARNKRKKAKDPKKGKLGKGKGGSQNFKPKKPKTAGGKIARAFYDMVTSLKSVKASYQETNGTLLPGYKPEVGFLGRDQINGGLAPSFGYVFGSQVEIRNRALENGWLVSRNLHDPLNPNDDEAYYNQIYTQNHLEKLDLKAKVSPFKNFDIDFTANRIYTSNLSEQMDVVYDDVMGTPRFNTGLVTQTGNFSTSFFMMKTSFDEEDALFNKFKENRSVIAERLLEQANNSAMDLSGFGSTSQQVILPAFIAAYSGKSVETVSLNPFRDIPLPNWQIRYRGLMKLKWFKKRFKNFSVSHAYRSSYSIVNYTNNLQYNASNPTATDVSGNYFNDKLFTNIGLIEEFSPLVKVDVKLKNSFSFNARLNKDRMMTLNFNNNTMTQNSGTEYVLGLGYRIKDLKTNLRLKGKKIPFKGDLDMKIDVSLRDDKMMVRYFGEDDSIENDQPTGGQNVFSLRFIADYSLTKNLQAGLYYMQDASKYVISTTYDRHSISSGISIKYILGN